MTKVSIDIEPFRRFVSDMRNSKTKANGAAGDLNRMVIKAGASVWGLGEWLGGINIGRMDTILTWCNRALSLAEQIASSNPKFRAGTLVDFDDCQISSLTASGAQTLGYEIGKRLNAGTMTEQDWKDLNSNATDPYFARSLFLTVKPQALVQSITDPTHAGEFGSYAKTWNDFTAYQASGGDKSYSQWLTDAKKAYDTHAETLGRTLASATFAASPISTDYAKDLLKILNGPNDEWARSAQKILSQASCSETFTKIIDDGTPHQIQWLDHYSKSSVGTDIGMTEDYHYSAHAGMTHGGTNNGFSNLMTNDGKYQPIYNKSGTLLSGYPIFNENGKLVGLQLPTWSGAEQRDSKDIPQTGGPGTRPDIGVGIDVANFGHIDGTKGFSDSVSGSFVTDNPGIYGQGSASYWLGAHGEASGGASIKDGQATVGASGMVGLGAHGEAQGSVNAGVLYGKGSAEATAGAWASGDASVGIGSEGLKAKVSAEAMAGVSGSAQASLGVEGVQVGVGVSGYAGVGIKANVGADFSWNKVELNVDVGAALGVGLGIKFNVDISPNDIVDNIKKMWPF